TDRSDVRALKGAPRARRTWPRSFPCGQSGTPLCLPGLTHGSPDFGVGFERGNKLGCYEPVKLERVRRGRDRAEVSSRVRAETSVIELGVVQDPAHRDLRRLAVSLFGLDVRGPALVVLQIGRASCSDRWS